MPHIRVNIIYHSGYGHTQKLAEAIEAGAKSVPETEVQLIEVARATRTHVTTCDAMILGCPTYMGNVSSAMKEFIDTVVGQVWLEGGIPGIVGSCFTSSGSYHGGKEFTLFALLSSMFQLGMTLVSLPPRTVLQNKTLGFSLGVGATSLSSSPDERPDGNELATAKALGAHVATVTHQIRRGK